MNRYQIDRLEQRINKLRNDSSPERPDLNKALMTSIINNDPPTMIPAAKALKLIKAKIATKHYGHIQLDLAELFPPPADYLAKEREYQLANKEYQTKMTKFNQAAERILHDAHDSKADYDSLSRRIDQFDDLLK